MAMTMAEGDAYASRHGGLIFTPYADAETSARLLLVVSAADKAPVQRGHWGPVEMTDIPTGTVVRVRSAACSGDCHCAAEIVGIVKPGHGEIPRA